MLVKKQKGFTDLGVMPKMMGGEMPIEKTDSPKPHYPSFYIDKDIGFTDADLDQDMIATVKITPKRISKTVTNGKETYSCDVEVRGIKLGKCD